MRYRAHNPSGDDMAPTTRIIRRIQTHAITRAARQSSIAWNVVAVVAIVLGLIIAYCL